MTTSNELEKEVCLQYDKDRQIQFPDVYLVDMYLFACIDVCSLINFHLLMSLLFIY